MLYNSLACEHVISNSSYVTVPSDIGILIILATYFYGIVPIWYLKFVTGSVYVDVILEPHIKKISGIRY